MPKLNKFHFLSSIFCALIFASCANTPEIKTVHTENNSEVETPTINQPPQATPNTETSSAVTTETTTPSTALSAETLAALLKEKPMSQKDMERYAYELGLDPKKPLTDDEKLMIEKRRKVRSLERSLDSQKERLNYSKVLPWLENDDEKIGYLSIPSIEGRQVWVNKNKIWLRNKNLKDYESAVESQDLVLGMPADFVKKSWGEPDAVESSGNPIYKNERWKYSKQVATPNGYHQEKRSVYLEGGRVVGWETE